MTVFFSQLINGLSLGSIYALIALGYSMVYGIILLLNFAHGDVIMVGAYMSWFVMNQLGLGPVTAVCATIITCTLLGVVIEKVAYTPLRSAPRISLLITAIGVSFFLEYTAELVMAQRQLTQIAGGHVQGHGEDDIDAHGEQDFVLIGGEDVLRHEGEQNEQQHHQHGVHQIAHRHLQGLAFQFVHVTVPLTPFPAPCGRGSPWA